MTSPWQEKMQNKANPNGRRQNTGDRRQKKNAKQSQFWKSQER
jgi:hypothetical protein